MGMKTWTKAAMAVLLCAGGLMAAARAAQEAQPAQRTIQAASGAQQDVQAAVDAARDGDTVLVPEGTVTWTTLTARTPAVRIADKAVTLRGAGIDGTVVVDGTGQLSGEEPLSVRSTAERPVRVSGFTFKDMPRRNSAEPAVGISGTHWRIDHCKFDATETKGRGIWGGTQGLIDNCVFVNCTQGVAVMGDGDASWDRPLGLGTAAAVYIEDCLFEYTEWGDGAIDAYNGARYVLRHNRLVGISMGHHGLDSGGYRSTFSFEIYNNQMDGRHMPSQGRAIHFRGGTGVVFGNTLVNYKSGIGLSSYRSFDRFNNKGGKWGLCDGTNPLDGNEDPSGYPCRDQIGRSAHQTLEPLYVWANVFDGGAMPIGVSDGGKGHVKEGRDYFPGTPRPGYTPYPYPHPARTEPPAAPAP